MLYKFFSQCIFIFSVAVIDHYPFAFGNRSITCNIPVLPISPGEPSIIIKSTLLGIDENGFIIPTDFIVYCRNRVICNWGQDIGPELATPIHSLSCSIDHIFCIFAIKCEYHCPLPNSRILPPSLIFESIHSIVSVGNIHPLLKRLPVSINQVSSSTS